MRVDRRAARRRGGAALTVAATVALAGACDERAPPPDPAEVLTVRTVGLAYLEENRLPEAEAEFRRLVEMAPDEPLGYANLGLTYLRMDRLEEAEVQVRRAIELGPSDPGIRLILAGIQQAQGRLDEARTALQAALAMDSTHARTLWALASLDADSAGPEAARRRAEHLGRLVALQEGNVAARVALVDARIAVGDAGAAAADLERLRQIVPVFPVEAEEPFEEALLAASSGRIEEAREPALAFHNVMRTVPAYQQGLTELRGPGGVLVGVPVVTFSSSVASPARDPGDVVEALRFTDATASLGLTARAPLPPGPLAVADVDGDRDPDLLVGAGLLRNDPLGFREVPADTGVAPGVDHGAFADWDNDGALDLYVSRDARGALLLNDGRGTFTDVTVGSGVELAGGAPLFLDVDHDGDLDLLVAGSEGWRAYRNDLDGTFTDVSDRAGLAGVAGGGGADAAFGDFDDDDDLDVVVADPGTGLRLLDNDRAGRLRDVTADRGLAGHPGGRLAVGDTDNDGFLDILVADAGGSWAALVRNDGEGGFAEATPRALASAASSLVIHDVALVDVDNDGWLDVVLAGEAPDGGEGGVRLLRSAARGRLDDLSSLIPAGLPPVRRVAAADLEDDGDLDLFLATSDGGVRFLRNDGGNANHYLKMELVGLSTGSGKNNHFGIGAKVEVRAGALYQTRVVTEPAIHIGLGRHARADVVRVRWTNGVPQNLFYPGANQSLVEEQILKGSCPLLFTWDGEGFEFVTDLMWKSALGMPIGLMALGDREYAPSTASREYVRVPGEALVSRDGSYDVRITKELWEVSYVDEVDLLVVDHPDSVDVFVDERFVFPRPTDSLVVHQVAGSRPPVSAVDHRGRDVLPALLEADDVYVDGLTPARYQGLAEPWELILDLGAFGPDEPVALYLRGWIFPTDASINVALSQTDALATAMPALDVVGADGRWLTAVPDLSFPAGKNKLVVQDLTGLFPTDDHRVRIHTNMMVYWDHAFVSVGRPGAPLRITRLEPSSAELRFRGFSRTYRRGGRFGPHWFDYGDVSTTTPWRPIEGPYTRWGDVLELVAGSDDRYPIMGPGDELVLAFSAASLPDPPEGWSRDFLLYTDGWIKDADLNTALGSQVGPLPFHGMTRYPYGADQAYPHPGDLDELHTRRAAPAAPLPSPAGAVGSR